MLDQHNAIRAAYGIPPLTWDFNLAAASYSFIVNDLQASGIKCNIHHSGTLNTGENVSQSSTPSQGVPDSDMESMVDAVNSWMKEDPYQTGNHASQTVWRGSKVMGCARRFNELFAPVIQAVR
ncbi:Cuticle-degrading protease [Blyttiomyces sp. JEL0837]|nr:Cuticle-degrading protease [Blyttiomyces sp. JEL0837]